MMPERPRIIFVSNTDTFFLSYRLPLAHAERERGAEVIVAAPPGAQVAEIEREGFRFVPLPLSRRGINPFGEAALFFALLRLYRELRPHLVHHLTIKPVLYGSLAARVLSDIAVVNAVTGLGFVFTDATAARLLRPMVKSLYRVTQQHTLTRTIFENSDDRNEFLEMGMVPEASSLLIPGLGVNTTRFVARPEPQGPPVVVMPCRMLWNKGVGCFVEAAEIAKSRGVEARFALVGIPDPGNPSSIPEAQLQAWQDAGVVEWWGQRNDMPDVFADANVVVLPTFYREGVPRVLLEAAASGRAAVATDMPGCREIVRDGQNGILVPPRQPAQLSEAISTLVNDAALRARFGRAGREIAEREFGEKAVIERMMHLHQELLARRTAGLSASPAVSPLVRSDG